MSAAALEARIADLQSEDLTAETLKDILGDMLGLEPADYVELTDCLCFKLFDLYVFDEPKTHQTMKDFVEAAE